MSKLVHILYLYNGVLYSNLKKNWKQQIGEAHGYFVPEARQEGYIFYNVIYMMLKGLPC